MKYLLYPQLKPYLLDGQLGKATRTSFTDASPDRWNDEYFQYTPTGGSRIHREAFLALIEDILDASRSAGYPTKPAHRAREVFDSKIAALLNSKMKISPNEASKPGVWQTIACVFCPGIVRWRFPGSGRLGVTSTERFASISRNVFSRLWWRAYVLHDKDSRNPLGLMEGLGEDELVQIMERPQVASIRPLSLSIARRCAEIDKKKRMEIMREAMKIIRRQLSLIALETLSEEDIRAVVDQVFRRAAGIEQVETRSAL